MRYGVSRYGLNVLGDCHKSYINLSHFFHKNEAKPSKKLNTVWGRDGIGPSADWRTTCHLNLSLRAFWP